MAKVRPLSDAEYKVMTVVWNEGGQTSARRIHEVLSREGYERASTYQLIHRCIGKGALERDDPDFICRALVERDEMQAEETKKFLDKVFDGSAEKLLAALVVPGEASAEEIERLRAMVRDVYRKD